jgi:N-acetyl-gamma-glutamyl-phosphate reductase
VPSVLVAGASGYAGALAARLVDRHPDFELAAITSRGEAGRRLSDLYPHHRVPLVLEELDLEKHAKVDAAIVAYPHGAAAPLVAALIERGVRVIDLSADFRLRDAAVYERWYVTHSHPDLLERAAYGLTELNRAAIVDAQLVACPGCFPTAAILALAPLAEAGLLADVVIDENVRPYGVGEHRHMPEIDQELARLGAPIIAAFTPHLLPLDQGELLSCYITPARAVGQSELDLWYAERYGSEPFIDLVERPPGVRDVRETNVCAIHTHADERTGKIFVFAAIDNLWKGTSSQALANLNLMFGYPEGRGIS